MRSALLVGGFGLASKFMGVAREQLIASSFGIGGVADAFNCASNLPLLCVTSFGGLNGALHSGVVAAGSSLVQRDKPAFAELVQAASTRVGLALVALTAVLMAAAPLITAALAPGLPVQFTPHAVVMLQIMAPMVLLSGWMGVCSGALTASRAVLAPSLVPLAGNIAFIALALGQQRCLGSAAFGPASLAGTLLASTACQWLLVTASLWHLGVRVRPRWFIRPALAAHYQGFLAVAVPAALSAAAQHIAAFTDMVFASYVPGAASSMGYAFIVGMAPFGVVSSSVLTPLLPLLSSAVSKEAALERLECVVARVLAVMVPLAVSASLLAPHVVHVLLSGRAFQAAEVAAVAQLLPAVCIAGALGVLRDVLTRVYYAQGNGRRPFLVSASMIAANAALDAASLRAGWGALGIVAATAVTNGLAGLLLWSGLRDAGNAGVVARRLALKGAAVATTTALAHVPTWWAISQHSLPSTRLLSLGLIGACVAVTIGLYTLFNMVARSVAPQMFNAGPGQPH